MVMVAMIRGSDAVTCYQCSTGDPGCVDPFTSTSNTCTGHGCLKLKIESSGRDLSTIYIHISVFMNYMNVR